jgi:hypothetical protein
MRPSDVPEARWKRDHSRHRTVRPYANKIVSATACGADDRVSFLNSTLGRRKRHQVDDSIAARLPINSGSQATESDGFRNLDLCPPVKVTALNSTEATQDVLSCACKRHLPPAPGLIVTCAESVGWIASNISAEAGSCAGRLTTRNAVRWTAAARTVICFAYVARWLEGIR